MKNEFQKDKPQGFDFLFISEDVFVLFPYMFFIYFYWAGVVDLFETIIQQNHNKQQTALSFFISFFFFWLLLPLEQGRRRRCWH